MAFADYLRSKGYLGAGDIDAAAGEFAGRKVFFGTLAYLLKFVEVEDADRIMRDESSRFLGFSDTALGLGLMTPEQVTVVDRFLDLPISYADLVAASRALDRDQIHDHLTAFGSFARAV